MSLTRQDVELAFQAYQLRLRADELRITPEAYLSGLLRDYLAYQEAFKDYQEGSRLLRRYSIKFADFRSDGTLPAIPEAAETAVVQCRHGFSQQITRRVGLVLRA